jgi:hypothetical protein
VEPKTLRNKALAPPSQLTAPPPSTEKVVLPLPPPVHELLPKLAPTDEIQLNTNVAAMFGKLNMTITVTEMCKTPSVRREVLKLL